MLGRVRNKLGGGVFDPREGLGQTPIARVSVGA